MTNTFTAERRLPLSNLDSQNHEEWKSTEEKKLAEEKLEVLSESFRKTIEALGEDSKRDGLQNTPERAAKTLCFLTKGYEQNIQDIVGDGIFQEEYDELIQVSGIDVYSLCEHHLLPFYGKVSVGYLPHGKVIGLSKIARVVEMYSRRFQLQERLTRQIAEAIQEAVNPRGVGVIIEATHMCMTMRGVSKPGSKTITSYMLGELRDNPKTRGEFLSLSSQHTLN